MASIQWLKDFPVKVLVAHPGTQYSFQLVKQLHRLSLLKYFYTGFAISNEGFLYRVLRVFPYSLRRRLANRIISGIPARSILSMPLIELKSLFLLAIGGDSELILYERNKKFQKSISDKLLHEVDVVIGFDTSSWILVERCKQLGKKFVLDVSIAHSKTKLNVYKKVISSYPDWNFLVQEKSQELIKKEQQEMVSADRIMVASQFSRNSLIDNKIFADKIGINPYGVAGKEFEPSGTRPRQPLKFVFVGLVDARKGIPLLLQVWNKLEKKGATLTLIGPVTDKVRKVIMSSSPDVIVTGKVTHSELQQILPTYDVFVFPSYFEGFGLVILEAMACGLPVITTTATAGSDVIEEGIEGMIIDPGNSEQLTRAMSVFLNGLVNLAEMGLNARRKALTMSWDAYGDRWKQALLSLS